MSLTAHAEGLNNAEALSSQVLTAAEPTSNIDFDKTSRLTTIPLAPRSGRRNNVRLGEQRSRIFRGRTKASY